MPIEVWLAPSRTSALARFVLALLLAAAIGFGHSGSAMAEPAYPQLAGRITDEAGLLSAADRTEIDAQLAEIEKTSTDQIAIVTLKSLQGYTIEDFGYQLGRHWGIGQKDKDNGLLLIVAPREHKVRIEVGRGLEPFMTDAMSKIIIENAILPQFRRGHFPDGIKAGVRDIKDVLLGDAEAVRERARVTQGTSGVDTMQVILLLFWIGIVIYILWAVYRSALNANRSGLRHGTSVYPSGSSGGWSGGGWSDSGGGGGGGGGGWSGGGGDFGGGGSSGSW